MNLASDTWTGDSWKTGGGSVWMQPNYDAENKLAYVGTGNGGPWMPDARPGDNLYTTSVIAVDITSGEIKGHHQYHWNDAWDWDEVSAPLADGHRAGRHQDREGFGPRRAQRLHLVHWSAPPEGPINFIAADKYVHQNAFESIDPETGRPSYDKDSHAGNQQGRVTFCPSPLGRQGLAAGSLQSRIPVCSTSRAHENLCSELGGVADRRARAWRALHRHPDRRDPQQASGSRRDVDTSSAGHHRQAAGVGHEQG